MVLAGYTVVGEFHYLHHGPGGAPLRRSPTSSAAGSSTAAERAGIRLTLLDTCYLRGGFGSRAERGASAVQRRDGRAVDRRGSPSSTGPTTCRIGAAVHSVRAVDPESISAVATWADEQRLPLHAHVSEQPQENADCLAAYGVTPIELLDAAGALSPRFTAVHATHVTAADIERARRPRFALLHLPDDRARARRRDRSDGGAGATAGVEMCVGSDSHAVIDPFEETRAVELDERLALACGAAPTSRRTCSPRHRRSATRASAGRTAARLQAGALADFVTVSFDSPRLAGSDRLTDPLAAVVFAAAPADVRHVVVGGDVVVSDGVHQRRRRRGRARAIDQRCLGGRSMNAGIDRGPRDRPAAHQRPDPGSRADRRAHRGVAGRRRRGRGRGRHGPSRRRPTRRSTPLGRCVMPGFVDSHSHLVFAGDRSAEFAARMAGAPYSAGGINVTVDGDPAGRATTSCAGDRAALLAEAQRAGTTTIEIKSGYGLSTRPRSTPPAAGRVS